MGYLHETKQVAKCHHGKVLPTSWQDEKCLECKAEEAERLETEKGKELAEAPAMKRIADLICEFYGFPGVVFGVQKHCGRWEVNFSSFPPNPIRGRVVWALELRPDAEGRVEDSPLLPMGDSQRIIDFILSREPKAYEKKKGGERE